MSYTLFFLSVRDRRVDFRRDLVTALRWRKTRPTSRNAGLATAMGSYNDNLKTKMGGTPLGDAMVQEAQKQAGQYQVGAVDEKSRLDLAASRAAIDANIADLTARDRARQHAGRDQEPPRDAYS
jgi:hypothetical protein